MNNESLIKIALDQPRVST